MVDITKAPGPNTTVITGPGGAAPAQAAPAAETPVSVGQDIYDWHAINRALQANHMDGWTVAGSNHSPVNIGQSRPNPAYDKDLAAAGAYDDPAELAKLGLKVAPQPFIVDPGPTFVIGVVSPDGRQFMKLTLSRSQPDAQGHYEYSIVGQEKQGSIDPKNPGYTDIQRVPFADGHQEYWGINSATGTFEKMPAGPSGIGTPPGWNDIKQVDDGRGNLIWVGTDPQGNPFQQVPNSPTIPGSKYVPGSVRQVQVGNKMVYRGIDAATQKVVDIPEYGSEPVKVQTTTFGASVYQPDANGNLQIAQNVAQPIEGKSTRWYPAEPGWAKQQTYRNGEWEDDVDIPKKIVSPEVEATQRALARTEGAIKPKGEPYEILTNIDGESRLLTVIADGNGGYTIPPNATARKVQGGPPTNKPVTATSNDQEYISRYNPETQQQENVKNPNWNPAATGDRTRQLREMAAAKQKELADKVANSNNTYTDDQANKDFNTWWDQEIEPRRQQLQFDQDQEIRKAQRDAQAQQIEAQNARASALSTASGIGQNAVTNYQAMQKNMVGPGFADYVRSSSAARSQHKMPPPLDPSAFMYQGPDMNDLAQYYTSQALQHISPVAASNLGTTPTIPTGVDLSSLNRGAYQPSNVPGMITINIGGQQGGVSAQPQQAMQPVDMSGGAGFNPAAASSRLSGGEAYGGTPIMGAALPANAAVGAAPADKFGQYIPSLV